MKKVTFLFSIVLMLILSSCGSSEMNKEEGVLFYNQCISQAEESVGKDKIDMFMSDYKDHCNCYLNEMVKAKTPIDEAMKLLEDKFEVFAKLQDLDCN